MPHLSISLLGPFEVRLDGQVIQHFESVKVRALLAYLAAESGRPHSRIALAGLLWPDWPEAAAHKNLRQALYSLRKTLGDDAVVEPGAAPFIQSDRQFITFQPGDACQIDVIELEKALAVSNRPHNTGSGPRSAVGDLPSAVALYRGPFLEGFTLDDSPEFEAWVLNRREHLNQRILLALSLLADWLEGDREYAQAEAYARRQLELEPWREKAHQQLMRLLALKGERVQALVQYENLRQALKAELNVEPSVEMLRLYEQIRDGVFPPQTETSPAIPQEILTIAPPAGRKHNLPVQLTSFIGREKEIEQVKELLAQHRLVTLTGSGGVGKTSLALQAAGGVLGVFPDGVYLVELAPLSDPELVVQACVHALGVIEEPGVPLLTRLAQYLEKKQLLLLLDNCEHVTAACIHLADALLKSCPRLHILATSREVLYVPGEIPFRVPPLAVPDALALPPLEELLQVEAVRLFVERAGQVSPGMALNEANAPAVVTICQRLDGIPLAIELAAARARLLSVEQIAARMDHAFSVLTGGSRAVLPRHQTLKAMIDWSYDLLSTKERLLLQRLSVFAGGWGLEAAEAVCAEGEDEASGLSERIDSDEVLDLLAQLIDKSLALAEAGEHETRYRMLETIRQYARDRLLESRSAESVRDRHLAYFAQFTGQAEPHLRAWGQVEWMDRLELELDNLRSAMEWSLVGQIELGLKMAADLMWLWYVRGPIHESCNWLEKLLVAEKERRLEGAALHAERALQRARALRAWAFVSTLLSDTTIDVQTANLIESVQLLRGLGLPDRRELGISLYFLTYSELGGHPGAEPEFLDIFHQLKDSFYLSEYIMGKGLEAIGRGELAQARAYMEESLALSREIGDLDGMSGRINNLGEILIYEGDYPKAASLISEGIAISRKTKHQWWELYMLSRLLRIAMAQGNYTEAARLGQATLTRARESGVKDNILRLLLSLQRTACDQGNYAQAAELGQEALKISQESVYFWLAYSYYYLGKTALAQGDIIRAEVFLWKALSEIGKGDIHHDLLTKANILQGCAALLCRQGGLERAARIFAATHFLFQRMRLGLSPLERSEHDEALAVTRLGLGEEAFAAAWALGKEMTLEQAVEYAQKVLES